MNLTEMLEQAKEDFADLHRVYDGEKRHTKAKEKAAAKKTAENYLIGCQTGGFKILKTLGEPMLAAVLAALGPAEISIPGLANPVHSWDELSKMVKFDPLVESVIKKILEAKEEQFLLRVLFLVSKLTE